MSAARGSEREPRILLDHEERAGVQVRADDAPIAKVLEQDPRAS